MSDRNSSSSNLQECSDKTEFRGRESSEEGSECGSMDG